MLTVLLWGLALAAVPLSRRLTGDYFSPIALIVGVWCGSFGLYALRLLPYPDMRSSTQVFLVAAVALLVGGAIAGQRLLPDRPGPRHRRLPSHPDLWVSVFALLGIVGTVWYVWVVRAHLGPDAFDSPSRVRLALGAYEIPSRYLFLQYFCLAAALLGIALRLGGVRFSWPTWGLMTICILCTWITTDRTQFFLLTLTAFFMYATRRGEGLGLGGLLTAVAVCVVLLGANFTLVGAWLGKTPKNLGLVMQLPGGAIAPPLAPAPAAPPAAKPVPPSSPTPTPADTPKPTVAPRPTSRPARFSPSSLRRR